MEGIEAFLDGEWDSLSKLFSCEDSDLVLHSNGSNFFSYNVENPLSFCENDATLLLPHHATFHSVSQESSHSISSSSEIESSQFFPFSAHHHPTAADFITTTSSVVAPAVFPDDSMEEILQLKAQMLCNDRSSDNAVAWPNDVDDSGKEMQLKRKFEDEIDSSQNPKKRRPRDRVCKQTSKRNGKAKKAAETSIPSDENIRQSTSSCSSEENDSINEASESAGKVKGSKMPATDPQSLYARKRRERINERLRILQNLVPNGTKVDISTMLEEAVHYVKFLQLQIKLLSSDDKWMYAPIAYNGMDIGLYHKIVPNL